MNREFWRNRRVFLTGHTGFKGAWLSLWLTDMGARVTGYALQPPTEPNLFDLTGLADRVRSVTGDVRDREKLSETMREANPEIVFHLAAQPLVLESYRNPAETFDINVMGTVNVLESVRLLRGVRAVVNVTSDKCYENREWDWGYRENDRLGGHDPYSSSKACAELLSAAYRRSFFNGGGCSQSSPALATVRSGNVIGGGDWAADRLMADCVRALLRGEKILVRNPGSVRPWQHVLEPLRGYLTLAEKLAEEGEQYAGAWNFGPSSAEARTVEWVVKTLCLLWDPGAEYETAGTAVQPERHEARSLVLDCARARQRLDWQPCWTIQRALRAVAEWTKAYQKGRDMRQTTLAQILEYERQAAIQA